MRAISLHQPFASLIACGAKPYETRDWAPPSWLIGQRIAIHAAARKPTRAEIDGLMDDCHRAFGFSSWHLHMPYGAVICTARLDAAFKLGGPAEGAVIPAASVVERLTSRPLPKCLTVRYDEFGDYAAGRWAWLLLDVQLIEPAVPAKGNRRWWSWEPPFSAA